MLGQRLRGRESHPGLAKEMLGPVWRAQAAQAFGREPEGAREGSRAWTVSTGMCCRGTSATKARTRRGRRAIRGKRFFGTLAPRPPWRGPCGALTRGQCCSRQYCLVATRQIRWDRIWTATGCPKGEGQGGPASKVLALGCENPIQIRPPEATQNICVWNGRATAACGCRRANRRRRLRSCRARNRIRRVRRNTDRAPPSLTVPARIP